MEQAVGSFHEFPPPPPRPGKLRGINDMLKAANKWRGLHLNPASLTQCQCSPTSQNCLALSSPTSPRHHPHPRLPSFPAEAASFVSLIFLPLSLSGNCNETCHLEMAPSPLPETLPHKPDCHFICSCGRSFSPWPLHRSALCWHWRRKPIALAPALLQLPVRQGTKHMGTNTRIKFRFG